MKKLVNKINKKGAMFWGQTLMMLAAALSMSLPASATGFGTLNTSVINQVLGLVMGAVMVLGAAVAIFGATQFAFAFKNDDADGKGKGMRSFLAGAMAFAIGVLGRAFVASNIDFTAL